MKNPTVREVIAELQKLNPDLPVAIYDPYMPNEFRQFYSLKVVAVVDQIYTNDSDEYKQGEILILHG